MKCKLLSSCHSFAFGLQTTRTELESTIKSLGRNDEDHPLQNGLGFVWPGAGALGYRCGGSPREQVSSNWIQRTLPLELLTGLDRSNTRQCRSAPAGSLRRR